MSEAIRRVDQIRLRCLPKGLAQTADFECVSAPLAAPAQGEIVCRHHYLSLDPYMRSQISGRHISGAVTPGDVMRGEVVAQVVESKDEAFQAGEWVRCFGGWQTASIQTVASLKRLPTALNDKYLALSLLGMPGLTAWAGLHRKAQIKTGDTVLIPAATGAVGSVAAQLAARAGCRVIGIAGADDKCRYAVEHLGYEACLNRHATDLHTQLRALCPNGVDVYFDLVGGKLLELASENLATHARVVLCGLMDDYNSNSRAPGPSPALWIIARATVMGLVVYDFEAEREQFVDALLPQVNAGELHLRHHWAEGLAEAPALFCELMRGENRGKAMVRL